MYTILCSSLSKAYTTLPIVKLMLCAEATHPTHVDADCCVLFPSLSAEDWKILDFLASFVFRCISTILIGIFIWALFPAIIVSQEQPKHTALCGSSLVGCKFRRSRPTRTRGRNSLFFLPQYPNIYLFKHYNSYWIWHINCYACNANWIKSKNFMILNWKLFNGFNHKMLHIWSICLKRRKGANSIQ